jgi:16S rRNA (cytosine1402-N4)-methyltransferase
LVVRRANFAGLAAELETLGWGAGVDFVYADLGLSSMQVDNPVRGFTWKHAGPLDMRMNPARGLSAAQWLARADEEELARALAENADEPHAALLARALAARRGALLTTADLAQAVRDALPRALARYDGESSVRRAFQAVRIAVNDEFGALDTWLKRLPSCLGPGGRVAVISFHSGEDRRVKHALRAGLAAGVYAAISDDLIRPSPAERRDNPRSASAKLRWARRSLGRK